MSDETEQSSGKPSIAVALHYNGNGAPRLTAKGAGATADNILRIAREHGIPLREDAALVATLSRVELGREIPRELYLAVAQVLAFAWSIKRKSPLR